MAAQKFFEPQNRPFPSYPAPLFQNESVQNLSDENAFDWHENEPLGGTHFHMNGFTRRQVLTQAKANSERKGKEKKKKKVLFKHGHFAQNYNTLHFCSSQKESSEKCALW